MTEKTTENYLDRDYVNEVHVQDFIRALAYDPVSNEHISAWTDALPTVRNSKASKRKLREQEAANPKGVSHFLLQYPLIVRLETERKMGCLFIRLLTNYK